MLFSGFGSAFRRARDARDPKKIALFLRDVPEPVIKAAAHHGVVWRLDAHPVDCVEAPNIILACMCLHFLDLSESTTDEHRKRLNDRILLLLGISHKDIEANILFFRWLTSQLGGSNSKMHCLAKRFDELAGANGFLNLMDVLKDILIDEWSSEQISALNDVKMVFRIR